MDKAEVIFAIIGTVVAVSATILGGVWFLISRAMSFGETRAILKETAEIAKQHTSAINAIVVAQSQNETTTETVKHHTAVIKTLEADQRQNKATIKKVDSLPCEKHSKDIDLLKTIVVQKFPTAATLFSLKFSPRKLSPLGVKVMEEINGAAFIEEHKEMFFDIIDKNNPPTALDVEQLSYAALLACSDREIFNDIKRYIYNSPSLTLDNGERYDLALSDVCYILSLPLRDLYLTKHPELL